MLRKEKREKRDGLVDRKTEADRQGETKRREYNRFSCVFLRSDSRWRFGLGRSETTTEHQKAQRVTKMSRPEPRTTNMSRQVYFSGQDGMLKRSVTSVFFISLFFLFRRDGKRAPLWPTSTARLSNVSETYSPNFHLEAHCSKGRRPVGPS